MKQPILVRRVDKCGAASTKVSYLRNVECKTESSRSSRVDVVMEQCANCGPLTKDTSLEWPRCREYYLAIFFYKSARHDGWGGRYWYVG